MNYIHNLILLRTYIHQTFGTDYPSDIIYHILCMLQYQFIKINCYQTSNIAFFEDKILIWGSFQGMERIIKPIKLSSSERILDITTCWSDDIYQWHHKSKIQLADHMETVLDHITKPTHKIYFLLQGSSLYVNDTHTQVRCCIKNLWGWESYYVIHLNETICKIKRHNEIVFMLALSGILYSWSSACSNCLISNKCFDNARILLKNVIKFNCSKTCIVAFTSDNKIYGLSITQCRQLCSKCGHNGMPQWTEYSLPNDIIPKKIGCGEYFTIIWTTCNKLYSLGDNYFGQLGLGDTQCKDTFQQIPFTFPRIKSIQCGVHHTIVTTVWGEIYVWGRNDKGQLGLGDESNRAIPTRLHFEF